MHDAYADLESPGDALVKGWVKLFNQHDRYSKQAKRVNLEDVRAHYSRLAHLYLPNDLNF